MKKQISAKNIRSQHGVALLFALGILAVLMVLGLAFVSNALIAQRISVNNSNRSQADVLAQSAINRVLVSAKLYSQDVLFNTFTTAAANLEGEYLVSKATANQSALFHSDTSTTDGIAKLGDLAELNKVFGSTRDYDAITFASLNMTPEWHLVTDLPNSGAVAENRIIGRYAYAVLPFYMFPQIDFTTVHSTMVTPANGVTPKQMGYNVLSNTLDSTNWYYQFGFGYDSVSAVPPNVTWRSYSQIFARTGLTDTSNQQKKVRRFFEVNYPPMIEAFMTINGTTHNYYHRFNLRRTDWATMTVADLLGDDAATYWSGTTKTINTAETKALPFLSRIASDKGTFADLTTRRKQIAANLIDYCINDTTTAPTSNVTTQPWTLTSAPAYTGNKQTDYIYEVGFDFSIIKDETVNYIDSNSGFNISPASAAATHNVEYALGVLPVVKLVKMYQTTPTDYNFACALKEVFIEGKITKCTVEVVYKDDTLPIANDLTATLQFDVSADNIAINSGTKADVSPGANSAVAISGSPDASGYKVQVPARDFSNGGLRTSKTTIAVNTSSVASLARVQAQVSVATAIVSTKLISIDEIQITKISVTPGNMLLLNSGKTIGFDYVNGPLTTLIATTALTVAADTVNFNRNFKFAMGSVKGIDPRQNLNADDWDSVTSVKATAVLGTDDRPAFADVMDITGSNGSYIGKCNTNAAANPQNLATAPSYTFDREAVNSPGYVNATTLISTAVFPDSGVTTMISPAELGRIHRGAKWETINLANADGGYNDTTTFDTTSVSTMLETEGTTYEEGDGGILDMIKSIDYGTITNQERYYTYGKIDLNLVDGSGGTPVQTLPGDYMYANWLYRVVDSTDIKTMVAELNKQSNPRLKTRSEVLIQNSSHNGFYNAWSTVTPSPLTTKVQMDEYPGNLVNLAEANPVPMVFKAIIKAQSVKDLGPETGSAVTITKMINGTNNDAVSIQKGRFDGLGDEITGEVSYLVTFVRHPVTNQFFVVDKVQIAE